MADEEVKRLQPTKETIREIFGKSGNECAFPGCTKRILDTDGHFIGQICHIEDAKKGTRFNKDMTNEQRRLPSNLMLMCYAHHIITNDEISYPAEALKKMKAEHEARYTAAFEEMYREIVDQSTRITVQPAQHLKRLFETLDIPYEEQYYVPWSKELTALTARLKELPPLTRQVLVPILRRSTHVSPYSEVLFDEVLLACNLQKRDLHGHLDIMKKYKIARYDDDDGPRRIRLYNLDGGQWDFWADLKRFCEKSGHTLEEFTRDFRFDLLD